MSQRPLFVRQTLTQSHRCDNGLDVNQTLKDFLKQQQDGMSALANAGIIGLHMVSGPLVGFGMGYGLDALLGTHPWGKIIFLVIGILAGFLNVYRDTKILLQKMNTKKNAK